MVGIELMNVGKKDFLVFFFLLSFLFFCHPFLLVFIHHYEYADSFFH